MTPELISIERFEAKSKLPSHCKVPSPTNETAPPGLPKAASELIANVPAAISKPPLKVLAPVRSSVPLPSLVKEAVPPIASVNDAEIVTWWPWVSIVPPPYASTVKAAGTVAA